MLVDTDYNRQRLAPEHNDPYYVPLSDLREFLNKVIFDSYDAVLDYGSGGSPYRPLFRSDRYVRADYVCCNGIDIQINSDGHVECEDGTFDLVLSTQVLEHVQEPELFLKEAFRVLRPGGVLVLTTHGIWEDHGCPYDFRRWTADGLRYEINSVGFEVKEVAKITTGSRAVLFLFSRIMDGLCVSRRNSFGWAIWLMRKSLFAFPQSRHLWMDRHLGENRVVPDTQKGHETYLILGCIAAKPL